MNIPIKFPSDAEVIAADVARFRAMSPAHRVRALGELFSVYRFLEANSGRPDAVARLAREDEERNRRAIEEFAARHV
jgi:hypothetical protein